MMPDTGSLQRYVGTRNVEGAPTIASWEDVEGYTDLPCSIQPASGGTRWMWQQRNVIVNYTIFFEREIPYTSNCRFVCNDGRIFKIHGYAFGDVRKVVFSFDAELHQQ